MVRILQLDDAVQQYADQRMLKRTEAEVGIIIGRKTVGKDFLLQLVCSPDSDGGSPIQISGADISASKKSSGGAKAKATSSGSGGKLILDEDWIVQHAALAARALPGGLDILGIYVLCDDKSFQNSQGVVVNTLKAINEELSSGSGSGSGSSSAPGLALHVAAITAKIAGKELAGAALRPCEIKASSLLPNMVALECHFPINLKISLAGGKLPLHEALRDTFAWQQQHRVTPAFTLINGKALQPSQQVADVLPSNTSSSLPVELLPPVSLPVGVVAAVGAIPPAAASGKGQYERNDEFHIEGVIDCRAYVHKREPLEAAVTALKGDIERTLLARLDVLVEAAEMATAAADAQRETVAQRDAKEGKPPSKVPPRKHPLLLKLSEVTKYCPMLPRRAFLCWTQGGCAYCDYVVEGEGVTEAVQRVQEVMGADSVDVATFVCQERAAASATAGLRRRGDGSGSSFECNALTAGAVGAILLAIYISWTFMM